MSQARGGAKKGSKLLARRKGRKASLQSNIAAPGPAQAQSALPQKPPPPPLPAIDPIFLARGYRLIHANLALYPKAKPLDPPVADYNQLTVGDMHGNSIKLLNYLVKMSYWKLTKDQFNTLNDLYLKDIETMQANEWNQYKIELYAYNQIVDEIEIPPEQAPKLVRLIGDLLCDRGSNDLLTIPLLRKIPNKRYILSNHDLEFLLKYYKKTGTFGDTPEIHPFIRSFNNMQTCLDKGIGEEKEVGDFIENDFMPNAVLIDYSIEKDTLKIYHHAPSNDQSIIDAARAFGVKTELDFNSSIEEVCRAIDEINKEVQESLKNGFFFNEFTLENNKYHEMVNNIKAHQDDPNKQPLTDDEIRKQYQDFYTENPMLAFLWRRKQEQAHQHISSFEGQNGRFKFRTTHVNGHDAGQVDDSLNLDVNPLGKDVYNTATKQVDRSQTSKGFHIVEVSDGKTFKNVKAKTPSPVQSPKSPRFYAPASASVRPPDALTPLLPHQIINNLLVELKEVKDFKSKLEQKSLIDFMAQLEKINNDQDYSEISKVIDKLIDAVRARGMYVDTTYELYAKVQEDLEEIQQSQPSNKI